MTFKKYEPEGSKVVFSDSVRISQTTIRFSNELWEMMGKPGRVNVFYEEETNRLGIQGHEDGRLSITAKSLKKDGVKEICCKSALKCFKIYFDKPVSFKVDPNGRSGEMIIVPLKQEAK